MAESAADQEPKSRTEISLETEEFAQSQIDKWDELDVYLDEPGYEVRTTWIGSSPLLVTKMWCEGLTSEHV